MQSIREELTKRNFLALCDNPYPGRGIIVGLNDTATHMVQIYWIMGRSDNSRNRVFKSDDAGRLYTEAADAEEMTDPSLVIYNAMREQAGRYYIVSNGDQTDTVADFPSEGLSLWGREYEPDSPNFTQRITSLYDRDANRVQMSILRKSPFGEACDRMVYKYEPSLGYGYCITTYAGDGDPLPPFCGDPMVMPLGGGQIEIANSYWEALNYRNKVSLAVKFINLNSGASNIYIHNKYAQKE